MQSLEATNRRTTSSVETFFDNLLRGRDKLTEHLFFEELPTTIAKEWKEVVLIDCGNPQSDHDAYSRQTVLIYLFAPANAYGQKDVKHLQELESRLNQLILECPDTTYNISIRGRYSNYNAVNDMFLNIVQINLIIT